MRTICSVSHRCRPSPNGLPFASEGFDAFMAGKTVATGLRPIVERLASASKRARQQVAFGSMHPEARRKRRATSEVTAVPGDRRRSEEGGVAPPSRKDEANRPVGSRRVTPEPPSRPGRHGQAHLPLKAATPCPGIARGLVIRLSQSTSDLIFIRILSPFGRWNVLFLGIGVLQPRPRSSVTSISSFW
jgi:hypothetical protein